MKWIKIEEKLPKIGTEVLVLVERERKKTRSVERHIRVGHRLSDRNIWVIGDNFGFDLGKVTYWMPLPELPVVDK